MFERVGRWCARHPWPVIVAWAVAFAVSLPGFLGLAHVLKVGGFSDEQTESARAREVLQHELGFSANELLVILSSPTLQPQDPAFVDQAHRALADVPNDPAVRAIVWHTDDTRQIGRDGHTAFEVVVLDPNVDPGPAVVNRIQARLHRTDLRALLGGAAAFYSDIEAASSADLHRAEFIAFPFAAIALLLVFRTLVAALLPVLVGGVGVTVAAGLIYLVAHVTDMSIFVLNVATMVGLGLGVDYSLFVTSRFREELAAPARPGEDGSEEIVRAVSTTASTASRAVFFSGLTVSLGLLALLTFNAMMLRSIGLSGFLVVACTVLAALTLLPALLGVIGRRIDAFQVLPRSRALGRRWGQLAAAVMARPLAFGVPALVLLLALGVPFLHVRLSSPDASILPPTLPSRQGFDVLAAEYPPGETTPLLIAVRLPDDALAPDSLRRLYDFTHAIAADPRVARVDSLVTIDPRMTLAQYALIYADPTRIPDPFAAALLATTVKGHTVLVQVISKYPSVTAQTQDLVRTIRRMTLGPGASFLVDGLPSEVHDVVVALYGDFPRALAFVVLSTYAVLFWLFRSAVLPIKAILMNTLSIVASYGALVFVFQDGHFAGALGFTRLGYVESTLPILMFCTLFGLSMDYEVFLLSRIKEAYDATGDNPGSVATGMVRSGRIITSGAAIVVLVSASFMAADIVLIKALGLGVALAVLLDATVVRALLVPSTMRLLGRWNWWAPRGLTGPRPGSRTARRAGAEG